MAMTRNLDPESTGFICWRTMLSYFILLQSKIPSEKEAEKLLQIADKDGHIGKDVFLAASFWFDGMETTKDLDYHLPFERVKMIKEQLFRTNAIAVESKEGPQVDA